MARGRLARNWRAFYPSADCRWSRPAGPDEQERAYLDEVWDSTTSVERLDGRLNWPALTALLADAQVFIGPDTSVTHLAAASGCPTVALYGPTDPPPLGTLAD